MADYNKILENIKSSIISNDYHALSDSIDQAYNTCPRSGKYKSAICFGYQHLAKHLSNPAEAIKAFDRARQMFPGDKELLEDEVDFLGRFIESNKHELCDEDYGLIEAIVTIIISSIPKSSKINTDRIFDNIKGNLLDKHQTTNKSETISNTICDTGAYLYFNLTDDIREKIAKELTPHLPDLFKAAKKLGLFDELEEKKKKRKG